MANNLEQDALEVQLEQRSIKNSLTNKGVDMNGTPFNDYHNKIDNLQANGGIGTKDYNELINKPSINGKTLTGDQTLEDLGLTPYDDTDVRKELAQKQPKGDYATKADIPVFTSQLTNDTNYVTNDTLNGYYPKTETYSQEEIDNKNFLTTDKVSTVAISGQYDDILNSPEIPKAISDLVNDSEFITNTVNNLTNYYTIANTYSRQEIDKFIGDITSGGVRMFIIKSIEEVVSPNIIYLLPTNDNPPYYDQYIFIDGVVHCVGTTQDSYNKREADITFVKNENFENSMKTKGNSYVKRLLNQTITTWTKEGSISEKYPYVGKIIVDGLTEKDWKIVDFYTSSPMFEFLYYEVDVLDNVIQFYASKDIGEITFETIDVSSVLSDLNLYVNNTEAFNFLKDKFILSENGCTKEELAMLKEIINKQESNFNALVNELKQKGVISGETITPIVIDNL